MRWYSFLSIVFFALLLLGGCNSSDDISKPAEVKQHECPKCYMIVNSSKIHSAKVITQEKIYYFDDIGCMVIYTHENNIDLTVERAEVFTNDTHKYIPINKARYRLHEKTPMNYGFVAYENEDEFMIDFNEVRLKMLRGEHMANPKIRKKVLGI